MCYPGSCALSLQSQSTYFYLGTDNDNSSWERTAQYSEFQSGAQSNLAGKLVRPNAVSRIVTKAKGSA